VSPIFIVPLKTLLTEVTRATFDADYIEVDFRDLWVSMEYPHEKASYPGIWVDFTPTAKLQIAGIDHREYILDAVSGRYRRVTRWRYGGVLQFTIVALTSLERDRLLDELVRVMSFGLEQPSTAVFRSSIENNDLIACQVQWDQYDLGGKAETPGTPWGSDEIVYEQTVSVDCQGDFVARTDSPAFTMVPLREIVVFESIQDEVRAVGYEGVYGTAYPVDEVEPSDAEGEWQ
jgi:hypothetical protein